MSSHSRTNVHVPGVALVQTGLPYNVRSVPEKCLEKCYALLPVVFSSQVRIRSQQMVWLVSGFSLSDPVDTYINRLMTYGSGVEAYDLGVELKGLGVRGAA